MRSLFLMMVVVFGMAQAVAAPSAAGSSIEGLVTRFGSTEPVSKAEIRLIRPGEASTDVDPDAITDSRGRFVIRDVPAGKYVIQAQRGGYANPSRNGATLKEGGAMKAIAVSAQPDVLNVNLSLSPGGVIAGRVLGADGQPAAGSILYGGIQVWAARVLPDGSLSTRSVNDFIGVHSYLFADGSTASSFLTQTDDRGEYRLYGLEAGKYYVWAAYRPAFNSSGGSRASWKTTYFPGVVDRERATVIEVAEGASVLGTDFLLQTQLTFTITGTVVVPQATAGNWRERKGDVFLVRRSEDGEKTPEIVGRVTWTYDDGPIREFQIHSVPPGAYELFLSIGDFLGLNGADIVGRTTVNVGGDVQEVTVVLQPTVDVRGRFIVTDSGARPGGTVRLSLIPEGVNTSKASADSSGAFTIPKVIAGVWKPVVSDIPPTLAVLDVRQSGSSVYEQGFRLEIQPTDPIEILLGPAGSVEGFVRDAAQQPIVGARVAVIPVGENPSPALIKQATTDSNGHFEMTSIAVGQYAAYAIDPAQLSGEKMSISASAVQAFLRLYAQQGTSVAIRSGMRSDLSLTPIRK